MLLGVFCLFIQYKEKNKTVNKYISYSFFTTLFHYETTMPKNKIAATLQPKNTLFDILFSVVYN